LALVVVLVVVGLVAVAGVWLARALGFRRATRADNPDVIDVEFRDVRVERAERIERAERGDRAAPLTIDDAQQER
jgi:hypothetical protein